MSLIWSSIVAVSRHRLSRRKWSWLMASPLIGASVLGAVGFRSELHLVGEHERIKRIQLIVVSTHGSRGNCGFAVVVFVSIGNIDSAIAGLLKQFFEFAVLALALRTVPRLRLLRRPASVGLKM